MDDSYNYGSGGRIRILPILIGAALIGFMALRGCQQGPFGRHQVVGMGQQQEAALGAQAYSQVLTQSHVLENQPVVDVVRRLAKELVAASRDPSFVQATGLQPPDFQWECNVVQSKEINAFCLPGGKIVVYTGILPIAQTENALAAVMGHEIGHALAHHGAERMAQQQMVQIAESSAAGAMSSMDPRHHQEVLGLLGVGGKFGLLLPFSRKHESEADHIGLLLMAVAGRDPHAAIDLWKRMARASKGGRPPEFMSTHPSDQRRIQDLEGLLSEAMPFYERAPRHIADRPLPLDGAAAVDTSRPQEQRNMPRAGKEWDSTAPPNLVPPKVAHVLKFIDEHHEAPQGYEGGRHYLNLGRDGEQVLPRTDAQGNAIQYQEWDVNPHLPGRNRGAERLITGSNGSAFFTPNHYASFLRIR